MESYRTTESSVKRGENEAAALSLVHGAAAMLIALPERERLALLGLCAQIGATGRAATIEEVAAWVPRQSANVEIGLRCLVRRGVVRRVSRARRGHPAIYTVPGGPGLDNPALPGISPEKARTPKAGLSKARLLEAGLLEDVLSPPSPTPLPPKHEAEGFSESGIQNHTPLASESESSARMRMRGDIGPNGQVAAPDAVPADAVPSLSADLSEAERLLFDTLGRALQRPEILFARHWIEVRRMPIRHFASVIARLVANYKPRRPKDRIRTVTYIEPALEDEMAAIEARTCQLTETTNGRTDGRGDPRPGRSEAPADARIAAARRSNPTLTSPEERERKRRLNEDLIRRTFGDLALDRGADG